MFNNWSKARTFVGASIFCGSFCFFSLLFGDAVHAKEGPASPAVADAHPLEISPEGVQALDEAGIPYILIQADEASEQFPDVDIDVRRIYYTSGPSIRAAQDQVLQQRRNTPVSSADGTQAPSQRLVGTPLEWHRLGIKFPHPPLPAKPLSLSPRQLAEALKDGVDLQLIDLRAQPRGANASFPKALHMMPHEVESTPSILNKRRWLVLIDDDGGTAAPIAEHLFRQGYLLTAVLEGGYAAWVNSTDR